MPPGATTGESEVNVLIGVHIIWWYIIIWLLHNEMYMWTVALQMGWFWILISTCFLGRPTFWNLFEVWGQHIHVWKTFGIKSVVFIVVWLLLQRTPLSWKCFEWYHVQACSWWTAKRWSRMPRHLFIKRWQWYAMICNDHSWRVGLFEN